MFTPDVRSDRQARPLVRLRGPRLRLPWWALALGFLARRAGRLARSLARHPIITLLLAFVGWLYGRYDWPTLAVTLSVLAVALGLWRWQHPPSFGRLVGGPSRSAWRMWLVYRRHWQPAMVTCELATVYDRHEYLPTLRRVISESYMDRVLVRMLSGQAPEHFERQTAQLAHTFGALACRVRVKEPGWLWLDFLRADPLLDPIPALPDPAADEVDLAAVPIGRQEDGRAWLLRLVGTHVLVAGVTGAGKGSVLWSTVRALGPLIASGRVLLFGIDPKGGLELSFGERLFTRVVYNAGEQAVELLEELADWMKARADSWRGHTRVFVPNGTDPFVLLVVDELADLVSYQRDRQLRDRANRALQTLTSQGRAPGFCVVGLLQDPRKEVLSFRNLFPTKVALRLDEAEQVAMVLGEAARDRGARADEIPEGLPGVGYVKVDGRREPVRVRAGWVSDLHLADMCDRYPAPSSRPTPHPAYEGGEPA